MEDDKWREKAADREKWKGITEEDDNWREKAADREKWEGITAGAAQQYVEKKIQAAEAGQFLLIFQEHFQWSK